jgi:hypothetical protein
MAMGMRSTSPKKQVSLPKILSREEKSFLVGEKIIGLKSALGKG